MKACSLPLLAFGLVLACEEGDCSLAGCADGFAVTVLSTDDTLHDGSYEFQLMLDDTAVTCVHPALVSAPRQIGDCSASTVRSNIVIHNGGAGGSGRPNAFGIQIGATPSVVSARVLYDGRQIGAATFNPTYRTVLPNGPECGPVCTSAPSEELQIQFE